MAPRRNSAKKQAPRRLEVPEDQNVPVAEIDYLPLSPGAVLRQKLEYKGWGTIESDPSIFTNILKEAGVKGAKVVELYSMDTDSLHALPPIFGLIFLFRWISDEEDQKSTKQPKKSKENIESDGLHEPWFANQVPDNACASVALLNIVLNASSTGSESRLELGEHLQRFREFTESFNPTARGMALTNFDFLRQIHNQYTQASELREQCVQLHRHAKRAKRKRSTYEDEEDEENFHFIAYVPVSGVVWQLDGLHNDPVKVAEVEDICKWPGLAVPCIQERISKYSMDEIRFNLMAVVPDDESEGQSIDESERALKAAEIVLQTVERRLDMIAPEWEEIMPPWRHRIALGSKSDLVMLLPNDRAEVKQIREEESVDALIDVLHAKEENLAMLRSQVSERESSQACSVDSTYASRRKHDYTKFLRQLIGKCLQDDENKLLLKAACKSRC
ncbi:ubiquitin carboxyl-terminal hydrolase [Lipomyces chichibuensis]|uniref:ubiquitin carboxyl-terminal hydrolase n=1 Tax=Lipomyces chichibuensis TaxID=1546026 RepID=UPI0033438EF6